MTSREVSRVAAQTVCPAAAQLICVSLCIMGIVHCLDPYAELSSAFLHMITIQLFSFKILVMKQCAQQNLVRYICFAIDTSVKYWGCAGQCILDGTNSYNK